MSSTGFIPRDWYAEFRGKCIVCGDPTPHNERRALAFCSGCEIALKEGRLQWRKRRGWSVRPKTKS